MRSTLKTFSIISVIIGALGLFGAAGDPNAADAGYAILGCILFFLQGLFALIYISQTDKENK